MTWASFAVSYYCLCHEKEAKKFRDSSNLTFFVSGGASGNRRLLGVSPEPTPLSNFAALRVLRPVARWRGRADSVNPTPLCRRPRLMAGRGDRANPARSESATGERDRLASSTDPRFTTGQLPSGSIGHMPTQPETSLAKTEIRHHCDRDLARLGVPLGGLYACLVWLTPEPFATEAECNRALANVQYYDGHRNVEWCAELERGGWCAMAYDSGSQTDRCFMP
jgi:hypothetical protein